MALRSRAVRKRTRVLSAADLPSLGFGRVTVTRIVNGACLTEDEQFAFIMNCGCLVRKSSECASPCACCRAELGEWQALLTPQQRVSPDCLDALATSCVSHTTACSYVFCRKILCSRHAAEGPDGRFYCPEHFLELASLYEEQIERESFGLVGFWLRKFCRSIFRLR